MHTDTAISVSHVSKRYTIGAQKDGSLRGTLAGMIGSKSAKKQEEFWALNDVSFDIKKGEVIGIIGKNGAGKSTLLKILSQITKPTSGRIEISGRVASLLEVGTGFHPELTGRENIYLNGTILGMTRQEVKDKFDEIVAFSGVEKFIDTPVKHYSSGMYVRLAFAVAAHLEPEILIIDEVLAVGDAEFQKRCLGKMKEVAGHGRTVIFVSHNMEAVKSLCERALWIMNGSIKQDGEPSVVIDQYLSNDTVFETEIVWDSDVAPSNEWIRMKSVVISSETNKKAILTIRTPFSIRFDFDVLPANVVLNLSMHVYAFTGECVFAVTTQLPAQETHGGTHSAVCLFPESLLNTGVYYIKCFFVKDETTPVFTLEEAISFEIHEEREQSNWHGKFPGFVRPNLNFNLTRHA